MAKKNTNPDGTVTVSLGETLKEVKAIADNEKRSMSKQLAVIVREWIDARKAGSNQPARGA